MLVNIVSPLLFCISANLDNIVIGIAYGTKKIKISLLPNLCIALITSISTFLSMYIGKLLLYFIPLHDINKISAFILILLGIYFLIHSVIHLYREHQKIHFIGLKNAQDMMSYAVKTDKDHSQFIDLKEAIGVSLSLAINNIRYRNCCKYCRN